MIAGALISSYVLAVLSGFADFLSSLLSVPANLLNDLLTWIAETLGLGFAVPENTIEFAWTVTGRIFPIAGPFDFAIGIILVTFMFVAFRWMFGRLLEGLR